jgi:hypothetical protein
MPFIGALSYEFQVVLPLLAKRTFHGNADAYLTAAFDMPVSLVSLGKARPRQLVSPRAVVPLGLVARGSHSAGAIEVAAAARSWERLPAPAWVSWFPERPYPQLMTEPRPGATLAPGGQLTLTFSGSISRVLGTRRPRLSPATPGRWRLLDAHALAFQPSGLGFGLGAKVRVVLPQAVHLAVRAGTTLTRTLHWQVPNGSTLRLQQLLAELGYLPLSWQAAARSTPNSPRAQLAAALSPPPGRFAWRYAKTPAELHALWRAGRAYEITRGALMMFEDTHDLAVDGLPGPKVWHALIGDAIGFVEASVRLSDSPIPSRVSVSVSAIPSRSEAAAPGWLRSSSEASCPSPSSARPWSRSAQATRSRCLTCARSRSGRCSSTLRSL